VCPRAERAYKTTTRIEKQEKCTITPTINKTGKTQPPEAGRTAETPPESRKSRKSPEFIRASGEICKKVKFYPPNPNSLSNSLPLPLSHSLSTL